MKTTIILEDYLWFVKHKSDLLAALNSAQCYCRDKGYNNSEKKYTRLWMQLYDIVNNDRING